MSLEIHHRFSASSPWFLTAAMLILLGACSTLTPRPAMPIADVISLSNSRQPEQVIRQIRTSHTSYALKGSDFPKLAAAGVSPGVLDRLQQDFVNNVDLLTRNWITGASYGGCLPCYPQPLDLSNLAGGGNGMGDASQLDRTRTFERPEGLPDWVTAVPGRPGAPGLTLARIEALVKGGTPSAEIAERIRASRLHDIIAVRGNSAFSAHHTAGVSGSDFAQLAKDGASDEVLDALQQKFLAEFIDFTRLTFPRVGPGPKNL